MRLIRAALLLLLLLAQPLAAQDEVTFDFAAWEKTATRAEGIIETAEASSPALETLRETLVGFRSDALALQDQNQERIQTLKSQVEALGPSPAEGASEAAEVAERRRLLTEQLTKAQSPVLAAQEAYKRADGLIGEIDSIIRDRLARQFFSLSASPLNPVHWPTAIEALGGVITDINDEIIESSSSQAQRTMARQNLPVSLFLLALGIVLLTRARHWLVRLVGIIPQSGVGPAQTMRAIILSLGDVIFPLLGLAAFLQAVEFTGFTGLRGQFVLDVLPWMGVAVFGASWLGRSLFNHDPQRPVYFRLSEQSAQRGLRVTLSMGVVLALHMLVDKISASADFPEEARVVLAFPVILWGGYLLLRVGLILDPNSMETTPEAEENPLPRRIFQLITRGTMAVGVVGPVLAAIGYFTASTSFVFPAIETLALLGAALVVQRLLVAVFAALVTAAEGARGAKAKQPGMTLLPVISGFALILACVPILALIWGARVSDISEVWTIIQDGFSFGDTRISVTDFMTFVIVFAIGYTITRLAQTALRTSVLPRTRVDAGGRNAILTGTGYVGVFLAAIGAITAAGLDLSSLAIVAGALSVGIGFGLQAVVSNFVSGIILLVERPIKEGDWIEVGSYSGYVRKISVRSTEIETFDRATVVVPNADFISGSVINWTHDNLNGRVIVPIGVAYGTDVDKVAAILREIGEAHPRVDPALGVTVYFRNFGADALEFELRVILKDVNWLLTVHSDLNFEIARRFAEEGIEVPFAQRDVHLKNIAELKSALHDPKAG